MAFDVNQFRAELVLDGARPNQFEIDLSLPTVVGQDILSVASKLRFFCRATQLPGSSIGMATLNYFGREIKVPGNKKYSEWTCTVYNDEDFTIRNAMERWLNVLNSNRGNVRAPGAVQAGGGGLGSGYSTDGQVYQYEKTGVSIIKAYKFIGIFPIDVSAIDVNWGADDTVEEFAITFAVQWVEPAGII